MARIARRERMRRVLAQWRRSGLSAAAFCRREGMIPQALAYWKRVLGKSVPEVRGRRGGRPVGFVPVQLVGARDDGAMSAELEIALASGDRLVLREGVSPELLRDALAALRERC